MSESPTGVSGAPRGPYAQRETRRADIIEAAFEMFSTAGFRGTSIREVARRVGMSQSGLLYYFPDKHELLREVLTYRDRQSRVATFGPDAREAILAIVRIVQRNAERPALVALHAVLSAEAAADAHHPAREYFVDRYRETVRLITAALQASQDSGVVTREFDAHEEARGIVALMDGLQVQWLLEPDRVDMVGRVCEHLTSLTGLTAEVDPQSSTT